MTTADAYGAIRTLPRDREQGVMPTALKISINTHRALTGDTPQRGTMIVMARMPDSVKTTLKQRLETHRAARWPQLARLDVRYRGDYAYIDAVTTDDENWPLCRLWGAAVGHRHRQPMGLRNPPRQPRQLPRLAPAQRSSRRHPRRSPRLLLRPLPRRPHSLDPTPERLMRGCTRSLVRGGEWQIWPSTNANT